MHAHDAGPTIVAGYITRAKATEYVHNTERTVALPGAPHDAREVEGLGAVAIVAALVGAVKFTGSTPSEVDA